MVTRITIVVFTLSWSYLSFATGDLIETKTFNIYCPFKKLLPVVDSAYHSCSHGAMDKSCQLFVETFEELIPKYDCKRSFDTQTVPAIWLADRGYMTDFIDLLFKLAKGKDKVLSEKHFPIANYVAKQLLLDDKFKAILDGHYAETYFPMIENLENENLNN